MDDVSLNALVSRWIELRRQGQDVSVTDLCAGHPDLDDEVRAQVQAVLAMESFLDGAASTRERPGATPETNDPHGTVDDTSHGATAAMPVERIGGYEIVAELGRGGMGVVYEALQVSLKRTVALKMILAGPHAGPEQLSRFRAEAEAIAQLQHPNIVHIYEVGEHQGRPFFSLEFVAGGSLDRRLKSTPMPPAEAATLAATLARAMHAVHGHGLVHRDLKPANVLLAPDGTPKITDFGLAKHLGVDVGATQSGSILGTPSYMAPEQAAGHLDRIGPVTDVYSLGAILYELLTGRPPFRAATILDTLEQVRSAEPVPPTRLQPKVPRDLETICLKCLRKEPAARYASAAALADDLQRFRDGRPILARPVGAAGRAWRWCQRNPVVAGLLGLVALILVTSTAVAWTLYLDARAAQQDAEWQAELKTTSERNAREEAARADQNAGKAMAAATKARRESERAGKVSAFLVHLFDAADPVGLNSHTFGPDPDRGARLTAKEVLDRGTVKLQTELQDDPEVRAALLSTMGGVYRNLGVYDRSQTILEEALALARKDDTRPLEHAGVLFELGWLQQFRGNYDQAEKLYGQAVAVSAHAAGGDLLAERVEFNTAWMCLEKVELARAEKLFRAVLAARLQRLGKDHPDTAVAQLGVGAVLIGKGQALEATEFVNAALETLRRHHGDNGFFVGLGHTQSALVSYLLGDLVGAEKDLLRAAAIIRKTGGERNLYMAMVYGLLGAMKDLSREDEPARAYYEQFLGVVRATVGLGHPMDLIQRSELHYGLVLTRLKRYPEACRFFDEILADQRKRFGPKHYLVGMALGNYAEIALQGGERDKAEKLLREGVALVRGSATGEVRTRVLPDILRNLAIAIEHRDPHAAEPFYREALAVAEAAKSPTAGLRADFADCLLKDDRPHDALAVLDEAGSAPEAMPVANKLFVARIRSWASLRVGNRPAAVKPLQDALAQAGTFYRKNPWQHAQWQQNLALVLCADGRPSEAARYFEQADKILRKGSAIAPHRLAEAARNVALCRLAEGKQAAFHTIADETLTRFAQGSDPAAVATALAVPLLAAEPAAAALRAKIDAARQRFPASGAILFADALAHYRAGEYAPAQDALDDARAAATPCDDAGCWLLRALIATRIGTPQEAQSWLERATLAIQQPAIAHRDWFENGPRTLLLPRLVYGALLAEAQSATQAP